LRFEGRPRTYLKNLLPSEKGSLLPKSKKFKFGPSTKPVLADGVNKPIVKYRAFSYRIAEASGRTRKIVGRKPRRLKHKKDDLVQELEHLRKK